MKKISRKDWIEGLSKAPNSIGLTFEKELNKKYDTDIFPDYTNIELKCTQRFSDYPITLFSKALEGPKPFETNYIFENFIEKYELNNKYIYINLYISRKTEYNKSLFFELNIDKNDNKLLLNIYSKEQELISTSYIYLDSLYERLEIKLKNLALIYASKKEENNKYYYRYYKLIYYKLLDKEKFLYLLEHNYIRIKLMAEKIPNTNKTQNRKIQFQINKSFLEYLFNKILEYNSDEKYITINSLYYFKNQEKERL